MSGIIGYPFDSGRLLIKKKSIRRELLSTPGLNEIRVVILGGSTTAEVRDMIEIFMLNDGIKPTFYESDYNRFFEDAVYGADKLREFAPDVIYVHTSAINIQQYPTLTDDETSVENLFNDELTRYAQIWDALTEACSCPIVQNNFELPHFRILGNLDAYEIRGHCYFIAELNRRFAIEARKRNNLHLNDINYISAQFGLGRWHEKAHWYAYKYAMNIEAMPFIAHSVVSIIKAIKGRSKKCLVLDLDNTLWGGVIGDDGVQGICLGNESPVAEAYRDFQKYVKELKGRGIVLAVCSKNEEVNAREGFSHPGSILHLDDFSEFKANWDAKHKNLREIASALNLGLDSLVFVDDNAAERDIVRAQESAIEVLEVGTDVLKFADIVDKSGFFETVSLSTDDLRRGAFYAENASRRQQQARYESYEDFLRSLQMVASISAFTQVCLERITQLTNKTNQFNLTTRRYTANEIQAITTDDNYIALYGCLQDKFGDNGLITVVIGAIQGQELHLEAWLMSCRVFNRGMEGAMLDCLCNIATKRGIAALIGYYNPTRKNGLVADFYQNMGFELITKRDDGSSEWRLIISDSYVNKNFSIEVRYEC